MAEILNHIIQKTKTPCGHITKFLKHALSLHRSLVVTRARTVEKKVFYEMRVISIPLFVCLFVCFVDSFVGLFSLSVNTRQTATCMHPFMHVYMQFVSRGLEEKKG